MSINFFKKNDFFDFMNVFLKFFPIKQKGQRLKSAAPFNE